MNVCLMSHFFSPCAGGVPSHVFDLGTGLRRMGHQVHVLTGTPAGCPKEEDVSGLRVHRRDWMDLRWLRNRRIACEMDTDGYDLDLIDHISDRLLRFIEAMDVSVVHGHNLHQFAPEYALALRVSCPDQVARILTLHEFSPEHVDKEILEMDMWDAVLTPSTYLWDQAREAAPNALMPQLVCPGIDVSTFASGKENPAWANHLGIQDRPIVLHPARMLPWKGISSAIRAMNKVVAELPEALLLITDCEESADYLGIPVDFEEEARQLVSAYGLEDNVLFASFSRGELPWVYNASSAVIYPVEDDEPFGLIPVEAMACGKPVICTRSGGMSDTVKDGIDGFLLERGDLDGLASKILLLLKDPHLAREMGDRAYRRVSESYSADRMAQIVETIYREAMVFRVEEAFSEMSNRGVLITKATWEKLSGKLELDELHEAALGKSKGVAVEG